LHIIYNNKQNEVRIVAKFKFHFDVFKFHLSDP